jgi:hypothetical protein
MATVKQIGWCPFEGSGDAITTVEFDMVPQTVVATIALHGTIRTAGGYAGIQSYRRRLPDGSDQPVNFGLWPSWPPVIFDFVDSIVYGIATGEDQWAFAIGRFDAWG